MFFQNGSSTGLDGSSPKFSGTLLAKSNGQTGALTIFVNVILMGKLPHELRAYYFGAKLKALKKPDGGLRLIAVGNTISRLSAKCDGYHVFGPHQTRYGCRQVGVDTRRGSWLASYAFRSLTESTQAKEIVFLKIEFENAITSILLWLFLWLLYVNFLFMGQHSTFYGIKARFLEHPIFAETNVKNTQANRMKKKDEEKFDKDHI